MENATRAQQRLHDKGYALAIDGDFGAKSFSALLAYIANARVTPLRTELGSAIARYFPDYGITTPIRIAHALAQQSVETKGFSMLAENLNYSATGLRATFSQARISDADCQRLGRKPGGAPLSQAVQAQIANLVYGGRWGKTNLGNVAGDDGWRYRGRGAKQTTGRANYAAVASVTGLDVIGQPELLEQPDAGMRAACIFWDSRHCNHWADADAIDGLTRAINGGTNGLVNRKAALVRAKAILL